MDDENPSACPTAAIFVFSAKTGWSGFFFFSFVTKKIGHNPHLVFTNQYKHQRRLPASLLNQQTGSRDGGPLVALDACRARQVLLFDRAPLPLEGMCETIEALIGYAFSKVGFMPFVPKFLNECTLWQAQMGRRQREFIVDTTSMTPYLGPLLFFLRQSCRSTLCRGTSLIRKRIALGTYSRTMSMALWWS